MMAYRRRRTGIRVAFAIVALAAIAIVARYLPDIVGTTAGTSAAVGSSAPALTPVAGPGGLRVVSTPGLVVDDMRLHAGQCHIRILTAATGLVLPDQGCTPGGIDPAVTQANIGSTICRRGYTATVRPPVTATDPAKQTSLADYGLPYNHTTEYDHLVSLELGGASTTSNLWPEPNRAGAAGTLNPKDTVENRLNAAVCDHQITLTAAQQAIASNWTTALQQLGLGN